MCHQLRGEGGTPAELKSGENELSQLGGALQAHTASKYTGQDRQAQKQGEVRTETRGSTAEPTLEAQHPGRCQLQGGPPFPKVSLRDQKCQLGNPGPWAGGSPS